MFVFGEQWPIQFQVRYLRVPLIHHLFSIALLLAVMSRWAAYLVDLVHRLPLFLVVEACVAFHLVFITVAVHAFLAGGLFQVLFAGLVLNNYLLVGVFDWNRQEVLLHRRHARMMIPQRTLVAT